LGVQNLIVIRVFQSSFYHVKSIIMVIIKIWSYVLNALGFFWASSSLLKTKQKFKVLISSNNLKNIVIIWIQTRFVIDCIGIENTTINHLWIERLQCLIKVFKTLKWFGVFQFTSYMLNQKLRSSIKYETKKHNMHNYNQFTTSQNLL